MDKRLNGCDSDDDGYYAIDFGNTMREVELERSLVLLLYDRIYKADEGGVNSVFICVGYTMDPDEVNFPIPPYEWVNPAPNI